MILGENIGSVYSAGKEIQRVYSLGKLVWEKQNNIDYSVIPFTVVAIEDTTLSIYDDGLSHQTRPEYFKYSLNGGDWKNHRSTRSFNMKKNDIMQFMSKDMFYVWTSGTIDISGNFMSLVYGEDFIGQTVWKHNYDLTDRNGYAIGAFRRSPIRNAENLVLPATIMEGTYDNMFAGCTSLITAPKKLPATTLSPNCYNNMFAGCTSLITAPKKLPATTLSPNCYFQMFMHSGIKKAPILPATRLVNGCYSMMFDACNDLTYVKCYATSCEKNDWEGCVGGVWIHQHDTKNGTFVCKKVNGGKNPIEEWVPDAWTVEYMD